MMPSVFSLCQNLRYNGLGHSFQACLISSLIRGPSFDVSDDNSSSRKRIRRALLDVAMKPQVDKFFKQGSGCLPKSAQVR